MKTKQIKSLNKTKSLWTSIQKLNFEKDKKRLVCDCKNSK